MCRWVTAEIWMEAFPQAELTDPFLYLRSDFIMVVFLDDYLIFAKNDSTINEPVANLSKTFLLEDEGTIQDYLGIPM